MNKKTTQTLTVGLLICLGSSAAIGATSGVTVQPNTIPESTISVPAEPKIKLEPQTPQPTNKPVPNVPEQQVKPKPEPEAPKPTIVPEPERVPSKPKPEVPTQTPEIPRAPVIIEKPQIPEDQIRDIRRIMEEIEEQRKWREEFSNEQLPGDESQEPEQSGRSVDDIISDILSEAQEPVFQPPTDKPKLPPVLSESELKKYAVPIIGGPAAEIVGLDVINRDDLTETGSDLRPGTNYGYMTDGDCIPIPGNPDPRDEVCVSDIYQCTEGECEKVGEQVQHTNCWDHESGETCDTQTVTRTCDAEGQCATANVRTESETCDGDNCSSHRIEYVCVPPSAGVSDWEITDGTSGLGCSESSRRRRDESRSESDGEYSEEWNCDDETGRCEVTVIASRENDDSENDYAERYDCPDNLANPDVYIDCELISQSTNECNAEGQCRRVTEGDNYSETVTDNPDGSQTTQEIQCDPETDRCTVTNATTSTDEDGNTNRSEEYNDCTRPSGGSMVCEHVGTREEICLPRTGRDPRTGEEVSLPSESCSVSVYGVDPNIPEMPWDDTIPQTHADGCPEGAQNLEGECESGRSYVYTCNEDFVCTGVVYEWDKSDGFVTERHECRTTGEPIDVCKLVRREYRSTRTLGDGSVQTHNEDQECDRNTGVCRTTTEERRCSSDGSRCTTTRTRRRHCASGGFVALGGYGYLNSPLYCAAIELVDSSETWTTECDAEGNCVREGEVDECVWQDDDAYDSPCNERRLRQYRVEETCRGATLAEGSGIICEITSSSETVYDDGRPTTTEIECNLETRVCSKTVTRNGSVDTYTCTPDFSGQPAPYTSCSVRPGGVVVPAPGAL